MYYERKPRTEDGERIYAIGDVHGCYDEMIELLDLIAQDDAKRAGVAKKTILFLGDLIDRGPDSAKVVDYLVDLVEDYDNIFVLMGNHEQAFLEIARGRVELVDDWLRMGGRRTLRSYGIDPDWAARNGAALPMRMQEEIPRRHLKWLSRLPFCARSASYFFCHAGVRPGVPLKDQKQHDLLWIREDFISHKGGHEAVIVHGHNIEPDVLISPARIGVDTGAYKTGRLSAVMLEGTAVHTISTAARASDRRHR